MLDSLALPGRLSAAGLRGRITATMAFVAALNVAAWVWALAAFEGNLTLLGVALVVYGLGLRHAVDADHIAAIDNVTRKLMQTGQRPVLTGLFFALGHSTVVIAVAAGVALAASLINRMEGLQGPLVIVQTALSAGFLFAIAAMNIVILVSIIRSFRRLRAGLPFEQDELDLLLNNRGLIARIVRPLFRLITRSWHLFPLGLLFGLGFETASEVAVFGVSAEQASKGFSPAVILVFPVLFAAGMALIDTADGVMMLGAYHWAFDNPARKLFYNMTITLVSVIVAVLIGGIETLGLISDQFALKGGPWDFINALNDNFNSLGFLIIAIFAVTWAVSFAAYRAMGLDRPAELAPPAP